MIAATDERSILARLERLEKIAAIHNEVAQQMLAAEYQLLRGTTAETAMRRLEDVAALLKPDGETP